MQGPRIAPIPASDIDDPDLQEILAFAELHSTPQPLWYRTMAHNPAVTKARAHYWRALFWGGEVPHMTKELMRNLIVQLRDCSFCSGQRSVDAVEAGMIESDVEACAVPDLRHSDSSVQAALRMARELTLDGDDDEVWDDIYRELRHHFTDSQIIELGYFAAEVIGPVAFVRSVGMSRSQPSVS